jgi:hypothetical protein
MGKEGSGAIYGLAVIGGSRVLRSACRDSLGRIDWDSQSDLLARHPHV